MKTTTKIQLWLASIMIGVGLCGDACIPPKDLVGIGHYVKVVDSVCDVLEKHHDFVDFLCGVVDSVPLEGMRAEPEPRRGVVVRVPAEHAEAFARAHAKHR
jgi:hypothetical protein